MSEHAAYYFSGNTQTVCDFLNRQLHAFGLVAYLEHGARLDDFFAIKVRPLLNCPPIPGGTAADVIDQQRRSVMAFLSEKDSGRCDDDSCGAST